MVTPTIEDAYRIYFPLIREKCSRMLRDPNEAQDIAQETFVKLWRHRDAIVPEATPTWLYRTATRLAVDVLRQRARRPTIEIDSEVLTRAGAHGAATERVVAAAELERLAQRTPKKELEVAILSRVDGLSHAEIGRVINASERTVRRRLRNFDQRAARMRPAFGKRAS